MRLLVIVPFFNSATFLKECLTSILNQTVPLHIIAVNDASTDSSENIVRSLNSPKITIILNEVNKGTYCSINEALKFASSDLSWTHYTIHGSDDVSLPNRFNKQFLVFSSNPNLMAVSCQFARVDYRTIKKYPTNVKTDESLLIFSRKVFDTIGYYDIERAGCDTEYKKRYNLAFPNLTGKVNECLVNAYFHENNLTKKVPIGGSQRVAYVNKFTEEHKQMILEKKFYREYK